MERVSHVGCITVICYVLNQRMFQKHVVGDENVSEAHAYGGLTL